MTPLRFGFAAFLLMSAVGCGGGGGGVMQQMKALRASASETASIQVCLDRIEDIDVGLQQVDRLLFKTPLQADSEWVKALGTLDQPTVVTLTQTAKTAEPYDVPGRNVPLLKVLRLHTASVLDAHPKKAKFASLAAALADLAGPAGTEIVKSYGALDRLHVQVGALKGGIAALKAEADKDTTTEARKAAIPAAIETLQKSIDTAELEIGPAEEKLLASVNALGQLKPPPEKLPLAQAVMAVTQRAASIEIESGLLAARVSIQTVTSLPHVPGELQVLAQRWLNEAVQDAVGQAKSAVAFKPKIEIGLQGISLGIEGGDTSKLDLGGVKDRLKAKVVKFYDQATGAPGAISSISEKVGFQARFLTALGTSMATMTGAEFMDSLPLSVPES